MKKVLLFLVLIFSTFISSSCSCFNNSSDEKEKIDFSIVASSSTYYLGDGYITIDYSEDSIFDVDKRYVKDIEYFIVGEDKVESKFFTSNNTAFFIANKRGSITIQARYKGVLSKNTITIVCDFRNEEIQKQLDKVFSEPLGFGASYYTGMDSNLGITIEGSEGIIELNEENKLEVVGIGQGTITIKKFDEVIYSKEYKVKKEELIDVILNELLTDNLITSADQNIKKEKLNQITKLDLSRTRISGVDFLKHFKGLKNLNLSNLDLHNANLEFINDLENLEVLFLDNINVTNDKFQKLNSLNKLKELSLKNNHYLSSLEFLTNFTSLEYLDISDTSVSDISSLSNLSNLKTLSLANTKVTSLESLIENTSLNSLNVSYLNISFNQVSSLTNFNSFISLELNGIKDVNIDVIANASALVNLSLSNCDLVDKDMSKINELSYLKSLDISFNGFDDSNFTFKFDNKKLWHLRKIKIGGNNFTSLPNLLELSSQLQVLDLSNSYYLTDISALMNYQIINELVLDYCNKLDFGEDLSLISHIAYSTANSKISIVGSLISVNDDIYEYITTKNNVQVRLSGEEYYGIDDQKFLKGYYTSLSEYVSTLEKNSNGQYVVSEVDGVRDIILYLKDSQENINEYYTFYVPYNINSITIYGRKNYDLKISFVAKGKFSLYLSDFYSSPEGSFLQGQDIDIVSIYGSTTLRGEKGSVTYKNQYLYTYNYKKGETAVGGRNIYLNAQGEAELYIKGGNGGNGITGESGNYKADSKEKTGSNGSDGGTGVSCTSLVLDSANITITGGDGGSGGSGGAGVKKDAVLEIYSNDGGNGGNGGNGGTGVISSTVVNNPYQASIKGGAAGRGGYAGDGIFNYQDGEAGNPGEAGSAIR